MELVYYWYGLYYWYGFSIACYCFKHHLSFLNDVLFFYYYYYRRILTRSGFYFFLYIFRELRSGIIPVSVRHNLDRIHIPSDDLRLSSSLSAVMSFFCSPNSSILCLRPHGLNCSRLHFVTPDKICHSQTLSTPLEESHSKWYRYRLLCSSRWAWGVCGGADNRWCGSETIGMALFEDEIGTTCNHRKASWCFNCI